MSKNSGMSSSMQERVKIGNYFKHLKNESQLAEKGEIKKTRNETNSIKELLDKKPEKNEKNTKESLGSNITTKITNEGLKKDIVKMKRIGENNTSPIKVKKGVLLI